MASIQHAIAFRACKVILFLEKRRLNIFKLLFPANYLFITRYYIHLSIVNRYGLLNKASADVVRDISLGLKNGIAN